jgi:hypothetical protein
MAPPRARWVSGAETGSIWKMDGERTWGEGKKKRSRRRKRKNDETIVKKKKRRIGKR